MIGKTVKFYYKGTKSFLTGVVKSEGCFPHSFNVNLGNVYITFAGLHQNSLLVFEEDMQIID